jgi:hypothetical protein
MRMSSLQNNKWLFRKGGLVIVALLLLAGCGGGTGVIETKEHFGYEVALPAESHTFGFDEYLEFARNKVHERNPKTILLSASRVTSCNPKDVPAREQWTYEFFGHGLYYLMPRDVLYLVWLSDGLPATIAVHVTGYTELSTLDDVANDLGVDYNSALQSANERGGAAFEQSHDQCELVVLLGNGQWLFTFRSNPDSLEKDTVLVCIDSKTGEVCKNPPEWWLNQK